MEPNPKQQRFVEEFLVDLNATQAAIRSGYSPASARLQGHRMITDDNIQNAIQLAMDERSQRTRITADRVLEELALIGFANMADYLGKNEDGLLTVDLSEMTREQAAAVRDVRIETRGDGQSIHFRMSDKLHALIAMNKHLQKLPRVQKVHFVEIEDPPVAIEDLRPADDKVEAYLQRSGLGSTGSWDDSSLHDNR
jgi:phage terminase small subunit